MCNRCNDIPIMNINRETNTGKGEKGVPSDLSEKLPARTRVLERERQKRTYTHTHTHRDSGKVTGRGRERKK